MRLDNYLINKNYFQTRNKAQQAIKTNRIIVNGKVITKNGYEVSELDKIEIIPIEYEFVSRGGYKLLKAIKEFNLDFNDKVVIDLGASTGGFTDCSLKFNAKKVYAIDVGTDQLDINPDNYLDIDYIVMDVSFISVSKLIFKLKELLKEDVKLILLIKPQFEAMNENINKNGVVKNKDVHINIINKIKEEFLNESIYLNNLTYSPLKGEKSGNIEYLALFSLNNLNNNINIKEIVDEAYNKII